MTVTQPFPAFVSLVTPFNKLGTLFFQKRITFPAHGELVEPCRTILRQAQDERQNHTVLLRGKPAFAALLVPFFIFFPENAFAMHIMEGFLPVGWASFWFLATLPFVVFGFLSIRKITEDTPKLKFLLALAGAFVFALSALKLPSLAGSSSHPTGIALGAILFGPGPMSVIGTIVLLFQALLLGHGGLTTLGANVFSMAVAGSFVAFGVYFVSRKAGASTFLAVFLAGTLGDISTYMLTAFQLGVAFPAQEGGILFSFGKFITVFAVSQLPLALLDGFVTATTFQFLRNYRPEDLSLLKSREVSP